MSYWKPGEEYPDGVQEDTIAMEETIPLDSTHDNNKEEKTQLSETTKNLPFMIRSDAEKLKKKEEIAALKELKSYMWSYRIVKATESFEFSTHPCSGKPINTIEEEECKRFSFGGFNPKVDEIMKERKNYRSMKKGVQDAEKSGNLDIEGTLNKYSALRGNRKTKRRNTKRNHE